MTCITTSNRALAFVATCVVLCGLCLWPVRDADAYAPSHATANRTLSSRSARGGLQRSTSTEADQAGDDDGVVASARVSVGSTTPPTSRTSALVETAAQAAAPRRSLDRPFRLPGADIVSAPYDLSCGRAPPLA